MKRRQWGILIALVLLNYIIFSIAFTQLDKQRNPPLASLRTPMPTFDDVEQNPVAWIVLPTCTPLPSRTPVAATATETMVASVEITPTVALATETPLPTATPTPATVQHEVQAGETLGEIAKLYSVTVQAIVAANNLPDPDQISVGQVLSIPLSGTAPETATAQPTSIPPTNTPTKPPTHTPTPTSTPSSTPVPDQFTGTLVWDPLVAPNCAGPAISNQSIIRDAGGNPVNGVRVEVTCYDNVWLTHPSGTPGEYEPGHYDFSPGQTEPQAWTCTARVFDVSGQPAASSEIVTIVFDTNECTPGGIGHQVAILNWTKHW